MIPVRICNKLYSLNTQKKQRKREKERTYVSVIDIVTRSVIRPRFVSRIILLASIPFSLPSYIIYKYDIDEKEKMIDIVSRSEKKISLKNLEKE